MAPDSQDFQRELKNIFAAGQRQGKTYIDIRSGDLHKAVGSYPGNNHRMPICCSVMRSYMVAGDQILEQPPKGNGASLIIWYKLPR